VALPLCARGRPSAPWSSAPPGAVRACRPPLWLLGCALLALGPLSGGRAGPAASPPPGTLQVAVQWARVGGVPPLPDQPGPLQPVIGPASGLRVQLFAAEAPLVPVAEQPTDAQGEATFTLPAGRYWVLVPWYDALPGLPGAQASGAYLPDGRLVLAWAAVEVAPAETTAVTLLVRLLGA